MPGIDRLSVDQLGAELRQLENLGVKAVLLFGIPSKKDELGSEAFLEDGIIQQALHAARESTSSVLLMTDVCLCEYTSHGQCGVFRDGEVQNDETLELLARISVSHARAGADIVAPSAMMDGQVALIREALDQAGFSGVGIMAYSAKYASAFYGPFRDAAESAPRVGDRKGYQMDPSNAREAIREIEDDLRQGADIVMVKPALSYLDIIRRARERFNCPLAAYNVSGEYALVRAAVAKGWVDEQKIVMEILTAMKRAGADIIISYHAPKVASWLRGDAY